MSVPGTLDRGYYVWRGWSGPTKRPLTMNARIVS
jgi:hypothetical protein